MRQLFPQRAAFHQRAALTLRCRSKWITLRARAEEICTSRLPLPITRCRMVPEGYSVACTLECPRMRAWARRVSPLPITGSLSALQGRSAPRKETTSFPALAVDGFGNVYTVWSDNQNVFMSSSSNQGKTWTAPARVNSGTSSGKANVFPWVAADAYG